MIINLPVKMACLEEGLPVHEIAKQLGYSRGHISGVINGRLESFKVKKSIALLLGRDFDSLWAADTQAQAEKTA